MGGGDATDVSETPKACAGEGGVSPPTHPTHPADLDAVVMDPAGGEASVGEAPTEA